jgi:hypothetical protein
MVFPHSHGVGTAQAVRSFKTHGADARSCPRTRIAWRASIRRTRRRTPAACAGRSIDLLRFARLRADPGNAGVPHPALLARLLDRQAGTGLPPPYLPKHEEGDDT